MAEPNWPVIASTRMHNAAVEMERVTDAIRAAQRANKAPLHELDRIFLPADFERSRDHIVAELQHAIEALKRI